jgi:hypothetical protein
MRMPQKEPHQFRARIAGRAENADFRFCRHGSTLNANERNGGRKLKRRRPREDFERTCRAEPAARAFTRERVLVPRWYGGAE